MANSSNKVSGLEEILNFVPTGKPVFYNDIVDEIVEDALNQGCEIVDIEGNEKLIRAGSIGAVLRYKL